jgi:hypothetical protein
MLSHLVANRDRVRGWHGQKLSRAVPIGGCSNFTFEHVETQIQIASQLICT